MGFLWALLSVYREKATKSDDTVKVLSKYVRMHLVPGLPAEGSAGVGTKEVVAFEILDYWYGTVFDGMYVLAWNQKNELYEVPGKQEWKTTLLLFLCFEVVHSLKMYWFGVYSRC